MTQKEPKTLKHRAAFVLGTWFGLGLAPKAPGTVGTLGAVPLQWALLALPLPLHWTAIAVVTLVGIWAAQQVAENTGTKDPQVVVIDEVAGVLIAMTLVRGFPLGYQALALVLFRLFDITKPGPVRRVERWQPTGLGVMADDLVAGAAAGLCAYGVALLIG